MAAVREPAARAPGAERDVSDEASVRDGAASREHVISPPPGSVHGDLPTPSHWSAHSSSAMPHSRTPSGSFTSLPHSGSVATEATTPQQQSARTPPFGDARASFLDISALSPLEYAVFPALVDRIKPAHSRRKGLLDEHAAIKFMRSEYGISVDDEVKIMSLFERLPLGLTHGHFFAMLRLASWAQQGHAATQDLLFTQTAPPTRRARKSKSHSVTSASAPHARHPSGATPVASAAPADTSIPSALLSPPSHAAVRAQAPTAPHGPAQPFMPKRHSQPLLVRPTPVVARPSRPAPQRHPSREPHMPSRLQPSGSHSPLPGVEEDAPDTSVSQLPRHQQLLDRPSAPLPHQQVSPLILASLNARSEAKRATRQASRPKTFTVLSSSSGQVERDKARLLTGQEAPPEAQPHAQHTSRRRVHAAVSRGALNTGEQAGAGGEHEGAGGMPPAQTIAPKPSYFTNEHGLLPAWLREQQEEDHVVDPNAAQATKPPSVLETLDRHATDRPMGEGERAAASIDRNTPFFPPHARDLERLEHATISGTAPAQYRALNAQTSESKLRDRLQSHRSRGALAPRRRAMEPPPTLPWGTQLQAGTYAGFKPAINQDLRLLTPSSDTHVRREFQHHFPPNYEPELHHNHQQPMPPHGPGQRTVSASYIGESSMESTEENAPRRPVPRRTRSSEHSLPRMQPSSSRSSEPHRLMLQHDATRPQLGVHSPSLDRNLGVHSVDYFGGASPAERPADLHPAPGPHSLIRSPEPAGARGTPGPPEATASPATDTAVRSQSTPGPAVRRPRTSEPGTPAATASPAPDTSVRSQGTPALSARPPDVSDPSGTAETPSSMSNERGA